MAIHGHYEDDSTPPAPYVRAEVYLPALRLSAEVEFLVDTGADNTALLPYDVGRMGVSARSVRGRSRDDISGIGGRARYKTTKALLRFHDAAVLGGFREFEIDVDLITARTDEQLPSLLGRDILNLCECTFNAVTGRVTLEPL